MCIRNKSIYIKIPEDNSKNWRLPKQIRKAYERGERPKMFVKCGSCIECRQERARNWTYKIWLEAKEHKEKCFITLTYADDKNGTRQVSKRNLQNFIKRLRKNEKIKNLKYFAAGEYGEKKGRAHYHIILLGYKPPDIRKSGLYSKKGYPLYTSNIINKTWGKGITTIQNFAYKEVAYLSLYLNKNDYINDNANNKVLKKRKKKQEEIELKLGIRETYQTKDGKLKTQRVKLIKDLDKKTYKKYKKLYNDKVLSIPLKVENEFNLYSKNIGFESYIKNGYYKYDLKIDGFNFERPKEYIRKILDNPENYNEEIYYYTLKELIKRREYAEKQWEQITNETERKNKAEEQIREAENNAKIKLYKKTSSIF